MSQTALQCKDCQAIWTRHTLLEDSCPQCGGEVADITHTANGQKFLNIIIPNEEMQAINKRIIYATGPSSLFSPRSNS